jgi:hypothetical protein
MDALVPGNCRGSGFEKVTEIAGEIMLWVVFYMMVLTDLVIAHDAAVRRGKLQQQEEIRRYGRDTKS